MTPPTILVTGATGQVGFELVRALAPLGRVAAPGREELDLRRPDAVRAYVRELAPSIVVNPAAYTAVDRAESESDEAWAVNAVAPGVLAEETSRAGALLVHFSTDYVFDGAGDRPYAEDAATGPRNVYGATKLEGERAVAAAAGRHLVFRTGWVYGARGRNFLDSMLRAAGAGKALQVVDDQFGGPTPSRLLAAVVAAVLRDPRVVTLGAADPIWGVYHVAAAGATSWHGFAQAILAEVARRGGGAGGNTPPVTAIPSACRPTAAERPRYSVLDTTKVRTTFGLHLPAWDRLVPLVLDERLAPSPTP
jgi:dTDP-4-dehydrorhamnose reductase